MIFEVGEVRSFQIGFKRCNGMYRSRQELLNEYLVYAGATIGFDIAENESLKVCKKVRRQFDRLI